MRIAIDGLNLFGNYTGVNGSLAELIAAQRKAFPSDEVVLYAPRDFKGPPYKNGDAGLIVRKTWFPGRWRSVRTLWRNFRLQSQTYRDKCELLHGPSYALPSLMAKPSVVTMHDVIAFSHPLFCTPGSMRIQKQVIPRSIKVARRVIVPSLAVKEELLRNIKDVREDKIDVIPWGVAPDFRRFSPDEKLAASQQLKLPPNYVLFVGNLEPKKNILTLIRAFFAAKMNKKLPHKLVIAGQMGWKMDGLERLIRELNAREYVQFTGYVERPALVALYNLADLFVLPSLVEGFGMPVLEAMACGCPVVVSSDPALVEVGAGAVRVAPYDAEKPLQPLREAMEDLLVERTSREELIRHGLERAKLFTWEKTARATRAAYEKALA